MKRAISSLVICLFVGCMVAQKSTQTMNMFANESLFEKGKEMFNSGNYIGCVSLLGSCQSLSLSKDRQEEIDFMLAMSSYQMHDIASADNLETFVMKYPQSINRDKARLMLASLSFFYNDYLSAIVKLKAIDQHYLFGTDREDYQYRLAYSYLEVDSVAQSRLLFNDLIHNSPKYRDAATYYNAWYDFRHREFAKAATGFESVKNSVEFSENAKFYLTQILFINHQFTEAAVGGEAIYRGMKNQSNKAELARVIGVSFYYTGETTKAIEYLIEYAEKDKAPLAGSMYLLGTALYAKKDYKNAIKYLKLATGADDALNQNAYYYLGCCFLKIDDKKNARMAFASSSNSSFDLKTKEESLYNYAMLIHETAYSGLNESVKIFEQFLTTFPKSDYADRVNDYLSDVYINSKNYLAALASIEKIKRPSAKILKAKQRILFQVGSQAFINGDMEKSNAFFTDAVNMGKEDSESYANAFFWRAETAYRQGKLDAAESDYQRYLQNTNSENKENIALCYYNLGYTQFKKQDISKAKNSFEKALSIGFKKNPVMTADLLNRLGDCRYYAKDYSIAENYYARSAQTSETTADYSLFQQSRMLGLQKQYTSQIKLLDKICADYPNSDYRDDALLEKAQTYQNTERKELAVKIYGELLETYPKSSLARIATVQLGMLYFGMNNLEKSIEWYKNAIVNYPGSDEANVANEDLKRIYKDNNRIAEYAQFLKSLDGKVAFSASEQDSLMYFGAEKIYMKGEKATAEKYLKAYLNEFAQGVFSLNANYYLATINMENQNYSEALVYFQNILLRPENRFTENAMVNSAKINFDLKEYEKAYTLYSTLTEKAESQKKRADYRSNLLHCAWQTKRYAETIQLANVIIENNRSSADDKIESRYYRVRSNMALQKNDNLVNDLTYLSADTRNVMGAEAKYRLAEYYFNTNNLKKAESEISDFIEKGTPHQHWLARSFILLSDLYMKTNDRFQAKQYLVSLKNNYKEKDEEIDRMLEERKELIDN